MSYPVGRYPRLAGPTDIPRLIEGTGITQGIPPPGCTLVRVGFPEIWGIVYGDPVGYENGHWFVEPLSEFVLDIDADMADFGARIAQRFVGPVASFAGTAGAWPVIYEVGSVSELRWLRCTFRGELGGGVEQFQTKVDLGNPGADPTLDEAGALALAGQLKNILTTSWNATLGNNEKATLLHTAEVAFTEVGVVELTQDDPSASDGSGGTQVPSYATQWSLFASPLAGTASGNSLPYEVSCAVTLQTDTHGPSGRGRMYLPPFASARMAGGGVFNASTVMGAGLFVGHFFDGITSGTPYEPIVVSHRQRQLREIERIYVGQVPDSQRRRRRSQDEARILAWTKA